MSGTIEERCERCRNAKPQEEDVCVCGWASTAVLLHGQVGKSVGGEKGKGIATNHERWLHKPATPTTTRSLGIAHQSFTRTPFSIDLLF